MGTFSTNIYVFLTQDLLLELTGNEPPAPPLVLAPVFAWEDAISRCLRVTGVCIPPHALPCMLCFQWMLLCIFFLFDFKNWRGDCMQSETWEYFSPSAVTTCMENP